MCGGLKHMLILRNGKDGSAEYTCLDVHKTILDMSSTCKEQVCFFLICRHVKDIDLKVIAIYIEIINIRVQRQSKNTLQNTSTAIFLYIIKF